VSTTPPFSAAADDVGAPPHSASRRERARAATIEEIKDTALRLMRQQGTTDVRFSEIAREMGMTAPALYRYFADGEELLTALIVDAYDRLGGAVALARDAVDPDDIGGRMLAVAQAYRRWASEEPQQFALILGMPVPGYAAPPEGPTTEAARRAMEQMKALFLEAARLGVLGRPTITHVDDALQKCLVSEEHMAKHESSGPPLPADTFQASLHVWSAMHGFTSLETYGHFDFLPEEARDGVFRTLVELAATAAGLPKPRQS